jgi:hypothetical protein
MPVACRLIDVPTAGSGADSSNVVCDLAPIVEAQDQIAREWIVVDVGFDEVVFWAKSKASDWRGGGWIAGLRHFANAKVRLD